MASPAPALSHAVLSDSERTELVHLLQRAAEIEHALLNAYLFAAASMKSTPAEFSGPRRAIQFEQCRLWKQKITQVARQEMMHLHYVQLMLRALGEPPYFGLPERAASGRGWLVRHWDNRAVGATRGGDVVVNLEKASARAILRFAAYESGDEVQEEGLNSARWRERFEELLDFEQKLRIEQTVYRMRDEGAREKLAARLASLYTRPAAHAEAMMKRRAAAAAETHPDYGPSFQSIGDLYLKRILPLFEKAFAAHEVERSNEILQGVLQNLQARDHEIVPITPPPVFKNFNRNMFAPLSNVRDVRQVIAEIAEEGEGAGDFHARTEALLSKAAEEDGIRRYATRLLHQSARDAWFVAAETTRYSHLYQFALIATGMRVEAQRHGAFTAAREPIGLVKSAKLARFVKELPGHFNACYLAMYTWLGALYMEPAGGQGDQRREALATLAAWPLMSMSVRPMLELISMFPIDPTSLFRTDGPGAVLSEEGSQLAQLLQALPLDPLAAERQIDEAAIGIFSSCAQWAASQKTMLTAQAFPAPHIKDMVLRRLSLLADLGEIKEQLPFRIHGGHSDVLPDKPYQLARPGADALEEDVSTVSPLFDQTLVLRFRFSGWALTPMPNDPDPPTDEAGCTGTAMAHAADAQPLDRGMRWQAAAGSANILREPRADLPEVGVHGVEVTLLAAGPDGVTAGYAPAAYVQSATGRQQGRTYQVSRSAASAKWLVWRRARFSPAGASCASTSKRRTG